MFPRTLGGLAIALAAVGVAEAQPLSGVAPRRKPAFVPSKPPAEIQQAAMKADAAPPAHLPAPTPVTAAPAVLGPSAHVPDLPTLADVNAACDDSCGAACDALCGPPGRFWVGSEWLYWGTKGNRLPPLVSFAPPGTARAVAGTIGGPGTRIVTGDETVNDAWRSGFRVYGGLWLDGEQTRGLEGDFFFLGKHNFSRPVGSNGTDILTRPFVNNVRQNANATFTPAAPFQDTQLVSFPNFLTGTATVLSTNEFFGFGANFVRNLTCSPVGRLDFLFGYRTLQLRDELTVAEDLTAINPTAGTRLQVTDRFRTANSFHGGVLGLAYERRFSHFYLNVRSTVALGNNRSDVDIDGSTIATPRGGPRTQFAGGLLAQPSNIGRYRADSFAVVPEVSARLGLQVTEHLRVYGGYNFLYWSNVVRPEDVVDLRVNRSQIPPRTNQIGALFPLYNPGRSDFWAHGVVLGAELRY